MITPLFGVTKNKGDRLWWVNCLGADRDEPNFKMIIPIGLTIYKGTSKDWEGITMVIFYFIIMGLWLQKVQFGYCLNLKHQRTRRELNDMELGYSCDTCMVTFLCRFCTPDRQDGDK